MDEGRPIFLQIAEQIENDIISGALPEETQVPSTNEFAAFYRINPATAGKGVNLLVDDGDPLQEERDRHVRRRRRPRPPRGQAPRPVPDRIRRPLSPKPPSSASRQAQLADMITERRSTRMTAVVEVTGLTKRFGSVTAVDDVSFTRRGEQHLRPARPQRRRQDHAHAAAHRPGLRHLRRDQRLRRVARSRTPGCSQNICFIKESQKYPDDFMVKHVLHERAVVLPELGRRVRRAAGRGLPAAARTAASRSSPAASSRPSA